MRVLIVEDEPDIREALAGLLRDYGFEVASASDGRPALEILDAAPPDVILLDALMTGMSGAEFLREQKQRPARSRIPVIVITALPAPLVVGLGAAAVLCKPFHVHELLDAIRVAVSRESLPPSQPAAAG